MDRELRVGGLALAVALLIATSATAAPQITGARQVSPAVPGQPTALALRAVDPDAPISGYVATLPDGRRSGMSACRPGSNPGAPFRPGDPVRFVLRPTFAQVGVSNVDVAVIAGGCEKPGAAVRQPFSVTVTLPGEPLVPLLGGLPIPEVGFTVPLPPAAGSLVGGRAVRAVAAAKPCKGARTEPRVGGLALARRATLCLINRERTRRGLRLVHSDRLLKRAATTQATRMVSEGFFAHAGADGAGLAERVRALGWPTGGGDWRLGENLGFGYGVEGTPASVVRAWMDSSAHRTNLLDRGFDRLGIAIVTGTPGDPAAGATFASVYGAVT